MDIAQVWSSCADSRSVKGRATNGLNEVWWGMMRVTKMSHKNPLQRQNSLKFEFSLIFLLFPLWLILFSVFPSCDWSQSLWINVTKKESEDCEPSKVCVPTGFWVSNHMNHRGPTWKPPALANFYSNLKTDQSLGNDTVIAHIVLWNPLPITHQQQFWMISKQIERFCQSSLLFYHFTANDARENCVCVGCNCPQPIPVLKTRNSRRISKFDLRLPKSFPFHSKHTQTSISLKN